MGRYSIKDLEKLSGIKAHTIRIWEHRYHVIRPFRTETNIRYYDDEQLKYLLNISLLLKNGLKISHISKLSSAELNTKIKEISNKPEERGLFEGKINELLISMIELNEDYFEKIFSSLVLKSGIEDTFVKVIYPFLEKAGILWGMSEINPAQEHFISCLIRQKLIAAIDGQTLPPGKEDSYLLFLPEGEWHEIGLLLASYILKVKSKKVYYLGQSVPFSDLELAYKKIQPDNLLTFMITHRSEMGIELYLQKLSVAFKKSKIFVAGNQLFTTEKRLPGNIIHIKSVEDFICKT